MPPRRRPVQHFVREAFGRGHQLHPGVREHAKVALEILGAERLPVVLEAKLPPVAASASPSISST
jgi:hypothetical protein